DGAEYYPTSPILLATEFGVENRMTPVFPAHSSRREPGWAASQPQYLFTVFEIGQQRCRWPLMKHRAALQREHTVGQCQHQVEIMLDDHDRHLLPKLLEHLEQLKDDGRR